MLPLLLACSPDALIVSPLDTEAFLDPEVFEDLPERAWIDDPAVVSVAGQTLSRDDLPPLLQHWPVFEIADDALGLVIDEHQVRLLVMVDRAALRTVLVVPTLAALDPADADGGGDVGLIFPAGTQVDPDLAFRGAVPMDAGVDWLTGTGWVSVDAVDVYAELAATQSWTGDRELVVDTPLLDAPDGEPFAWLDETMWARSVGDPEADHQLVEIARPELTVRGYVPAVERTLSGVGGGFSGFHSSRCGLGWFTDMTPTVFAGTVLLDAPDGVAVGLALEDLYGPILDREDGFALVEVTTRWGPVELWSGD